MLLFRGKKWSSLGPKEKSWPDSSETEHKLGWKGSLGVEWLWLCVLSTTKSVCVRYAYKVRSCRSINTDLEEASDRDWMPDSFVLPRRCHAPSMGLHCVTWHHPQILELPAECRTIPFPNMLLQSCTNTAVPLPGSKVADKHRAICICKTSPSQCLWASAEVAQHCTAPTLSKTAFTVLRIML